MAFSAWAKAARSAVWNRRTVAGFRLAGFDRSRYRSSTTLGVTPAQRQRVEPVWELAHQPAVTDEGRPGRPTCSMCSSQAASSSATEHFLGSTTPPSTSVTMPASALCAWRLVPRNVVVR